MYILGIRIDTFSRTAAIEKVRGFLYENDPKMIFTPNPEMLVDAQKDSYFKEILNKGDLNICDGKGIQLVSKEKIERISGVDFLGDVCGLAEKENKSVYLLGSGSDEVLRDCQKNLQSQFPLLKIVGQNKGARIQVNLDHKNFCVSYPHPEENEKVIDDIIDTAPDILFVAFGHIKQEKWIYEFLPQLPSVKIAMGVGGSFDFIGGKVKRAPQFLRSIGLEWLWRLMREPRRIKRIWKATIVFLVYVLKSR